MARFPDPGVAVTARNLLERARGSLSQAELGRRVGLTQAALSRYLGGQREPTFTELQRIIGGTDYRLHVSLRPEKYDEDAISYLMRQNSTTYRARDLALSQRLPRVLNPGSGRLPASEPDGPRIDDALLFLYELADLRRAAGAPWHRLQKSWERYRSQRDRDLIHNIGAVGDGVGQAAAVMAQYIDEHVPLRQAKQRRRKADEDLPRVERLVWSHIVCAVRAEAAICRERASWMHQAMTAADDRRRAQDHLERVERTARDLDRAGDQEAVAEGKARLARAEKACAAWSQYGAARDVGRAGESTLAVELEEFAQRAQGLYEQLAAEPAFAAWRAEHAPADPLYDCWLDGPLRDACAPPEQFASAQAFADQQFLLGRAWRDRATETGWREQLDQAGAAALFSTTQGRVVDQFQRSWDIALIAPDPAMDARARREDDVLVAAVQADDSGPGAVYLLAENAHGPEAAEAIAAAPRTLPSVAAALHRV
ncbi:helix-turn-helix transcriptional regulator [Streptomyces sp. NPDC020667]|uniref:helix-turn-helix domain-containing protein n=1 Tax=Streptomyces sp. NPDC020667 TaxID=3154895 RepID=UPI0033C07CE2